MIWLDQQVEPFLKIAFTHEDKILSIGRAQYLHYSGHFLSENAAQKLDSQNDNFRKKKN